MDPQSPVPPRTGSQFNAPPSFLKLWAEPADYPSGPPVLHFGLATPEPNCWEEVGELVRVAKRRRPHLLVFLPHWGFEFEHWPGAIQRAHAHKLIELGFDVIVGSSQRATRTGDSRRMDVAAARVESVRREVALVMGLEARLPKSGFA